MLLSFTLLPEAIDQEQNEEKESRSSTNDDSEEDVLVHNPHFVLLPFRRFVASLVQEFLVHGIEHVLRRPQIFITHIDEWRIYKTKIFSK